MKLCDAVYSLMSKWDGVFTQQRTTFRAIRLATCLLLNPSRNTITQSLVFGGLENRDWSADYKISSRSKWNASELFDPIIQETVSYFTDNFISVAVDDTKVKKTGKKIPLTQYHRDPLSPPFTTNLIFGHRIMQFAALLPLYKLIKSGCDDENKHYHVSRGIPVLVDNVPPVKKPGKRASAEQIAEYKKLKEKNNLSLAFVNDAQELRIKYDEAGVKDKTLLIVADGSFCNSTVFRADIERTDIVARCRKDARLCFEDTTSSRCFYSKDTFTPLSIFQNKDIEYKTTQMFLGKASRVVRYKDIDNVIWQGGARRKKLRLIVIAPKPYKSYGTRQQYKQEAYILTTNHDLDAEIIIQQFINRWEIEVNHRDEKNNLGLGQAQVWNNESTIKIPSLLIASYSMLLLASLECYGPTRTDNYLPQPKWRKGSVRPSCNDLVNLMRKEVASDPDFQKKLNIELFGGASISVNQ